MIDKAESDILAYCGDAKETNALAGETRPSEPNHIPGKSKSFKKWWQQHAAAAPPDLQIAAGRACATLEALEMKTKGPASRAYMELCARDLDAFKRAWEAHAEGAR
jgi:hypothetical protein